MWLLAASGAAAQTMRGVSLVEDRIALVIGNAAYKRDALDNPVNDARLIARTLEKATFQVTLRENLDRAGMFNALREFGARLNENTVAVLYYAGHALQLREQNFMIPIDAEIRSEDEIPVQGIDLSYILAQMSRAKSRVNVVILDACRDNPFAKRSSGVELQGLAQMDAPVGTFLAYATAPGTQ
ncbi:MAG TPA: caspase family protein, partial [Burkholderiaceae bacterium]|nr:caspase family protein [Burkholderiaceae bacterium]